MRGQAEKGRICYSAAGRDSGKMFVIVDIPDDTHVMIADGDQRKIGNPKKKNIRHIRTTGYVLDGDIDGMSADELDSRIRKKLKTIQSCIE